MTIKGKIISRPYHTHRHTAFIIDFKGKILPCIYTGYADVNAGDTVVLSGEARERGTWQEFAVQKLTLF